jgi:hypothetical protein
MRVPNQASKSTLASAERIDGMRKAQIGASGPPKGAVVSACNQ